MYEVYSTIKSGNEAISIVFDCCENCPFVLKAANGYDRFCNQPSEVVINPYSDKRKIADAKTIPASCILKPRNIEDEPEASEAAKMLAQQAMKGE